MLWKYIAVYDQKYFDGNIEVYDQKYFDGNIVVYENIIFVKYFTQTHFQNLENLSQKSA